MATYEDLMTKPYKKINGFAGAGTAMSAAIAEKKKRKFNKSLAAIAKRNKSMDLCIALDLPTREQNLDVVFALKNFDNIWYKVGLRSFIRDGRKFIKEIQGVNKTNKIFLDLKLHDTQDTMVNAANEIVKLGINAFTVHAAAGREALRAVSYSIKDYVEQKRPEIYAVTVLTNHNNAESLDYYGLAVLGKTQQFARIAYECLLDGCVCSAQEAASLRKHIDSLEVGPMRNFKFACPGIRDESDATGDHKRPATIIEAKAARVNMAIVGRPITLAKDHPGATAKFLASMSPSIAGMR